MIASKYNRNSAIHQTLELIGKMPANEFELKSKVTREAMGRFMESCINPLIADKLIVKKGSEYHITEAGEEKMLSLGPTKKQIPKRKPTTWMDRPMLVQSKGDPIRPGADDHEQCPSLAGNTRKWRDGRIEVINV